MSKKKADAPHVVDVHVGQTLRSFRLKRGLSQKQLADTIDVTFQQVQKYEKGTNRISASKLFELANALAVSVGDFFSAIDPSHAKASRSDHELLSLFALVKDAQAKKQIRRLLEALAAHDYARGNPTEDDEST